MPEISNDQLLRWAAMATLADSYMSLVHYRRGIKEWDTGGTPRAEKWELAMHKARHASKEMSALLKAAGIDGHAIASEMDCQLCQEQVPV